MGTLAKLRGIGNTCFESVAGLGLPVSVRGEEAALSEEGSRTLRLLLRCPGSCLCLLSHVQIVWPILYVAFTLEAIV